MDIIKRHIEKFVLLAVLLIFIIVMIFVLMIVADTREITDTKLQIPKFNADYVPQEPSDAKFNSETVVGESFVDWKSPGARKAELFLNHFSDLVIFPGVAKCPGDHCGKFIPVYYFSDKTCPECGFKLPTPERPSRRIRQVTADDSDGDGITDLLESRYNLDSRDPADALLDKDGDGFSNVYEVENNYNPIAPMDHPPLWYRLKFTAVRKIKLPVEFKSLMVMGDNPAEWDIQLNEFSDSGKPRTRIYNLNSRVNIDGIKYVIEKIEHKLQADGKTYEDKIILKEIVKSGEPDIIEMQAGQPVYSADQRAILKDVSDPKAEYVLRPGQRFTLGNRNIGIETYQLKEINSEKNVVTLINPDISGKGDPTLDKNGRQMIVTADSEIPSDSLVQGTAVSGSKSGSSSGGSSSSSSSSTVKRVKKNKKNR